MNATTTTLGAGTAVLSVDSLAAVIHWLAVHYQVTPLPDDMQAKAAAILLLATAGTVLGGAWLVIRAVVRKWLVNHEIPLPNGETHA